MPALTNEQKVIVYTRLAVKVLISNIANEIGVSKTSVLLANKNIRDHGAIVRKAGSGSPKSQLLIKI